MKYIVLHELLCVSSGDISTKIKALDVPLKNDNLQGYIG